MNPARLIQAVDVHALAAHSIRHPRLTPNLSSRRRFSRDLFQYALSFCMFLTAFTAPAETLWWEVRVYQAPNFTVYSEDGEVTIDPTSTQTGLSMIPLSNEAKALIDDRLVYLSDQRRELILRENQPDSDLIAHPYIASSIGQPAEITVSPKQSWKYMESVPETSPRQYILRETKPESIFSLSVTGDYTDETQRALTVETAIKQTLPHARESLPGVDHNVGEVLFEEQTDSGNFTLNLAQWHALVWQRSGQEPLVCFVRVYTDKMIGEKQTAYYNAGRQYALESKIVFVKGKRDPNQELDVIGSDETRNRDGLWGRPDNVVVLDGSVTPIDAWTAFEEIGASVNSRRKHITGFRHVRDVELTSAPRVTGFMADPAITDVPPRTLYKLVLTNQDGMSGGSGGGKSNNKGATNPTNFVHNIQDIMGTRHNFFDDIPVVGLANPWTAVADFHAEYVDGPDGTPVPIYDGFLLVSKPNLNDDPRIFPLDYAFLTMEIVDNEQQDHYFRVKYDAQDGKTVAFYFQKSDTEHYFIFNTLTLIDPSGARRFSTP